MQEWIIAVMEQYGYIGIFALILIENLFPPIPSEIILSFGGFMTKSANMSITIVILVSTLGSVIGAIILYKIGSKLNSQTIKKIVGKYGHVLRLKVTDVDKTLGMYRKYQYKTVFFGRMIPMVRSLISIPAGMAKMKMSSFIIYTACGSAIWNTLIVSAGAFLGNAWHDIVKFTDAYSEITLIIFILVLICVVFYLKRKRG